MTLRDKLTHDEDNALRWLIARAGWLSSLTDGAIDTFDPWGSAMGAAFEAAEELTRRGVEVPADWDYSPGLGLSEEEPAIYLDGREDDYVRLVGNVALETARTAEELGFSY